MMGSVLNLLAWNWHFSLEGWPAFVALLFLGICVGYTVGDVIGNLIVLVRGR